MSFQSKIRSHNHKVIKIALQTADSTTVWPGNCAVFAVSKNQLQLQLQRPFPLLHEFSQKPLSHWRLQATAYIYNHNSTHNNNNKNKSSYHDQKNQVISTQQWGSERVGLSRAEHVLSQSAVHNLNKKNYQWSSLQRSYNTFSWNWLWNLKFKRHKGRGQSIHVHAHAPLSSREHSKTAHRLPTTEACIAWRNALKKENWHGRWHGHLTCVYFNVIRQPRLHCTAHCNSTLDSIIVAKRRFQPGFFSLWQAGRNLCAGTAGQQQIVDTLRSPWPPDAHLAASNALSRMLLPLSHCQAVGTANTSCLPSKGLATMC